MFFHDASLRLPAGPTTPSRTTSCRQPWPFTAVHGRTRALAANTAGPPGQIESGELQPGDRVPSIRSLAQEYEVATTTAQKVVEALRDEGLIVTSPMGAFVAEHQ
ncbi:MAG TPA: winged helix-turn-helix domain-containing protein [Streptosporangiaceae bacterium]|nr:winged helix-turn-helix domain-containing protein [Streptosporangiaceae bacterium]